MAKGGLSNSLLGKTVMPAHTDTFTTCPHTDRSAYTPDMHPGWPKNFEPNYAGGCTAKIEAVWTSDNYVMVALVDPFGHCAEAFLKNLKVRT